MQHQSPGCQNLPRFSASPIFVEKKQGCGPKNPILCLFPFPILSDSDLANLPSGTHKFHKTLRTASSSFSVPAKGHKACDHAVCHVACGVDSVSVEVENRRANTNTQIQAPKG